MNTEIDPTHFRQRLAEIIGVEQPFTWAKRIGIPSATFDRIWNGGAVPKADMLVKIALGSGRSIDWLLAVDHIVGKPHDTADSPPNLLVLTEADHKAFFQAPDEDLAALVADGLSNVYKEEHARLSPADLGRMVTRITADAMMFEDASKRPAYVAGALAMIRRELRKPIATQSSKHSA